MKAALALASMTVAELAEAIPPQYRLSVRTLDRMIQGHRAPNDWEIGLFAERLGVPEWFLLEGLPTSKARQVEDRDRELQRLREELEIQGRETARRLDEIAEQLRELMRRTEGVREPAR